MKSSRLRPVFTASFCCIFGKLGKRKTPESLYFSGVCFILLVDFVNSAGVEPTTSWAVTKCSIH